MKFAQELEEKGFFTHHFRFMYDLRSDDYSEISRSQSDISYVDASNSRNLFLHYDFRDVWERVFFRRIGEKFKDEGYDNKFTQLVAPTGSRFQNLFEGISKSLSVKISAPVGPVLAELGFDIDSLKEKNEIPLKTFNRLSRELFFQHCSQYQFYFFVDELVFSRLDAKQDEITLRAAMVRDILRCVWELNNFCAEKEMAFHFIASLRPEIRNLINDYDSESGKFLDGKDVELSWISDDGDDGRLIAQVFRRKVEQSLVGIRSQPVNYDEFVDQYISFGKNANSIEEFLLTNTWGRPRDVVRLLSSIQKKSPNSERIGEAEIKAALDDYSRASSKELIDELGVSYGQSILQGLRKAINRKTFSSKQKLLDALQPHLGTTANLKLLDEFFEIGLLGGYDPKNGYYFWAHRGESYLKDHHSIRIHPALWNDFSIRNQA